MPLPKGRRQWDDFFLWEGNTAYPVPPHQLAFPTGQAQQPSAGQAERISGDPRVGQPRKQRNSQGQD